MITSSDYAKITGRSASEAIDQRIRMAYLLFLNRIGCTETYFNSLTITDQQEEAAKIWIARLVEYLYDNDDSPPEITGFRLGKFEQKGRDFIDMSKMAYPDMILKSCGLIKRKAGMK